MDHLKNDQKIFRIASGGAGRGAATTAVYFSSRFVS